MVKHLKGVIFGIRNVLVQKGQLDKGKVAEVGRLVAFLRSKGITSVFFGNEDWTADGKRLQDVIDNAWGKQDWLITNVEGAPHKPTKKSIDYLLNRYQWDSAEAIYVGNTEHDMQTAVNGKVLFLNATWYGQNSDYGFYFASPQDIARFVDIFCLREHLWHYSVEQPNLRYYALAPYSTMIQDFACLSADARSAAKFGGGHPDFWTKYLWSSIYFSELHKKVDYIAVYPGHSQGSGHRVMAEPMQTFGKCFRIAYLGDFIVRHTTARKSAYARSSGEPLSHQVQLNTIMLSKHPLRGNGNPYKSCPVTSGKTVLVIDDICTNGYSLEAAKAYIKQTGANVIGMSWLKTINSPYMELGGISPFDPFRPNSFGPSVPFLPRAYSRLITDSAAAEEVTRHLQAYSSWQWP